MIRIGTALGLSAATLLPVNQDPSPSYRASTDLVSVYATVTDDRGRFVSDLAQDDFLVYDDGVPRPIVHFSRENQPFAAVVMLDRSGSMQEHLDLIRDAGLAFIDQFRPDDVARIGSFSTNISIRPEHFTSNRDELRRALREDDESRGGSPVWTSLDRSIDALESETRRRVVVLMSDGHSDREEIGPSAVIARARERDVMIYAVGLSFTVRSRVPARRPRGPEPPRFPFPPGRGGWVFPQTQQQMVRTRTEPPDPRLRTIAAETGGGYFELKESQDLKKTFATVADDLHHQYWLGFSPENLDGKVHRLEVRIKGARLHVRARQSYIADLAN
jgi:VWFA-related protein